jgi:hypothetical protein
MARQASVVTEWLAKEAFAARASELATRARKLKEGLGRQVA